VCRNVIDFLSPVAELAKRGNRRGDGGGGGEGSQRRSQSQTSWLSKFCHNYASLAAIVNFKKETCQVAIGGAECGKSGRV